jgi:hypothetical protein
MKYRPLGAWSEHSGRSVIARTIITRDKIQLALPRPDTPLFPHPRPRLPLHVPSLSLRGRQKLALARPCLKTPSTFSILTIGSISSYTTQDSVPFPPFRVIDLHGRCSPWPPSPENVIRFWPNRVTFSIQRRHFGRNRKYGSKRRPRTKAETDSHGKREEMGDLSRWQRISQLTFRLQQACRTCQKKKIRCDGNTPCTSCMVHKIDCVFTQMRQRRGSRRGYVVTIVQRDPCSNAND